MNTGGPSALLIIVWVVAANALLIATAVGLVWLWRKKSRETIRELGEQIRSMDDQLNSLVGFINRFALIDQEPYFTPMHTLQEETVAVETRVKEFIDTCRAFETELNAAGENRMQSIINAPFVWFRRWRQSAALRKECGEIAAQLGEAESRMRRIDDLPWELANECRKADQEVGELFRAVQELQNSGARGVGLQKAASQVPMLQRSLNEVSPEFLEADREELLASANMDSTIRVFEVLNRVRPALNRYLPQAREWRASLQKSSETYNELRQAGANLRQLLAKPVEGLAADPLLAKLDQAAQLAADHGQELAQPDVERLKPLAREIAQIRRVVQDIEGQFNRASQQASELALGLTELNSSLEALAAHMAEAEQAQSFPLAWDESGDLLVEMRRFIKEIGEPRKPRPPEEIARRLKHVEQTQAEAKRLAVHVPQMETHRKSLAGLMESADLREGTAWLRKAREMLEQAGRYDSRNWQKQDSLATLPAEIEELAALHNELAPNDPMTPVKESELEERLKAAQRLAGQHKALRPRVESTRARLEKIQSAEKEGKDRLTAGWAALERVALLAESNPLIEEMAGSEIDRLGEEIRQLGGELNAREQGEIDRKMQKVHALSEKVNHTLAACLARLNAAVSEQGKQAAALLDRLDAIGSLEDPAVQEMRGLLGREELTSARGSAGQPGSGPARGPAKVMGRVAGAAARLAQQAEQKSAQSELEITAEIKRKNDFWQNMTAGIKALEEKSAPILEAYTEAMNARAEAVEKLAELSKSLPTRQTWPPSNQPPLPEEQALGPADEKRAALKKQPNRADWTIQELGKLAQQYRLTAERAAQVRERVAQDQERVQELEWQIADVRQRWLAQAQGEPGNAVIGEGVKKLTMQTDSKQAYIKQEYLRGALTYEQALRSLQLLYDELFTARVPVDDQNDVGLNETHRAAGQVR